MNVAVTRIHPVITKLQRQMEMLGWKHTHHHEVVRKKVLKTHR